MKFTKMQAYGNDYVYINAIDQRLDNLSELAKFLSNRHFGVGSDGMVLICPSDTGDFRMRMFNPDGTEGEMCGNALRSLSKYVYDHGMTDKTELKIETLGGMQHVQLFVENGKAVNIRANIGAPVLDTAKIPINSPLPEFIEQPVRILDREFHITAVSWGNPHCVMFIDDVASFDVERYGKEIENKIELFPNKTNVTFAQVVDKGHIKIREWERGAGETIGCGTGCCTATVAAVLTGRCDRHVFVEQIGGVLETLWDEREGVMYMKGPSHTVFEGEIEVDNIIHPNRKPLKQLLQGVDYTLIKGSLDRVVNDIKYDSRAVESGDLFLARVGTASDSHDFLASAIEKGAAAVVIEKDVEVEGEVTVIRVESSKKALALMSAAYFDHPAKSLTTVGVTGTAGKTSTTFMLKAILEKAGHRTGIIGTICALVDERRVELHNTTPESYEVQKLLREMADSGCEYALMEVSSQGLKMNRVDGFTFDYGVFTNISPEHIGPNEHESFEEYLQCKSLLFRRCRVGVINADCDKAEQVIAGHTCEIVRYGLTAPELDERASNIEFISNGDFFGMGFTAAGIVNGSFKVAVPGRFSVYNALCAATIAGLLGIPREAIAAALETATVEGRMELVSSSRDYRLIVDYAHNEDEMRNLMETIAEYKPERLICIFGGGGNRARARRFDMGEIGGKYADLIILTEDNPRFEELSSINADIISGINKSGGNYVVIEDRKDAIRYAIKQAHMGDIILLIGKGHERYQEIKGVRYPWSDREAAKEVEKEIDGTRV